MTKEITDAMAMKRALTRITYEIIEKNKGTNNLVLVGIKTRGVYLAKRIATQLKKLEGVDVPVEELDVTNYRDDLAGKPKDQIEINFQTDLSGKHVVLVDDVFYTGRTMRAAMDALMDHGRPRRISVAVLVDRGHREMPIQPDFVGKNIPTSTSEAVKVNVSEIDDKDNIELVK